MSVYEIEFLAKDFLPLLIQTPTDRETLIQRFHGLGYKMYWCHYIFSQLRKSGVIRRVKHPNGKCARNHKGKYFYQFNPDLLEDGFHEKDKV